jgi:hypothetical protein
MVDPPRFAPRNPAFINAGRASWDPEAVLENAILTPLYQGDQTWIPLQVLLARMTPAD